MSDSPALFQRLPDTLTAEIEGELVALNVEKGTCYGLNAIATRVWNLIEAPMSLDQICDTLTGEYDVDRSTCEAEVEQLLNDFVGEGLVRQVRVEGQAQT